ncbi:MAG: amino acid permease [Planctomycetes bacterium]|nr:amino acid permease [Planctomycetota bacterium]
MADAAASQSSKARFGTFGGVFVPNVLTILGLIYFLRTGWVVGQVGMVQALLIVAIANAISLMTGLSLSAVATSMTVRTGGAYFILTRTLGLEFGGAIGLPLFLSQAVSVAFYVIGFTEALEWIVPGIYPYARWISTGIVLSFGLLAWVGADFAIKIQYLVLAVLLAAIASFYLGGWTGPLEPVLGPVDPDLHLSLDNPVQRELAQPQSFWVVFAVYFPAVTGIMVGASMSGDLKNPGKSIPRGTLLSIAFTAVIYITSTAWVSLTGERHELLTNNLVMQDIAIWPHLKLVLVGVWAATLSSALGSVLAAPRTLQALAGDRVVPRFLSSQLGHKTEPRAAVLVTTAIGVGICWAGSLNFVATIITMFFLSTYGTMNLAAGIEKLIGNPSYRPTFNLHWSLSLLGAAGCFGAMFLINVPATLVVIAVILLVFLMLERRSLTTEFADLRSGIWASVARHSLLKLEAAPKRTKNWRPNVIAFTGQPRNRKHLVKVGEWLLRGQGILSFVEIVVGDVEKLALSGVRHERREAIATYLREQQVDGFAECQIARDFFEGAITVAQSHGLAGLEPNTILMGLSETPDGLAKQQALMPVFSSLRKSVLLLSYDAERGYGDHARIDVWWGGKSRNGELMLLLAHIIRSHRDWAGAKIRLLQITSSEAEAEKTRAGLEKLLADVRVKATPKPVIRREGEGVPEAIARTSGDADLTIIGMQMPTETNAQELAERVHKLINPLGSVLMVRSAETEDVLSGETVMIPALPG